MLQDINASCIGDMTEAVEYFNSIIGTDYDGFILPTETVVFDSAQIKNVDNLNPTANPDVRYSQKWITNMPRSDLRRIEYLAKSEINSTDNYIDNITKWLYNDSKGKHLFALYSTENEENPTILYASNDSQAIKEMKFLQYYIELKEKNNERRPETFDRIFDSIRSKYGRNFNNSVNAGLKSKTGRNANVYSRKQAVRCSKALRNCLRDCWRRELAERVEENKYSTRDAQTIKSLQKQNELLKDDNKYLKVPF